MHDPARVLAMQAEARVSVASTAVKCQCELLRALPHFNHREELIDVSLSLLL